MTAANRIKEHVARDDKKNRQANGRAAKSNGAKSNGASNGNGATAAPRQPAEGRDAQGRFVPGNTVAAGNPAARRRASLHQAFMDAFTDEDVAEIAAKVKELAKQGDPQAMKLALAYTIGRPSPAVDADKLNQHEWETIKAENAVNAEFKQVVFTAAPEPLLDFGRTIRYLHTCRDWNAIPELVRKCLPKRKGKRGKVLEEPFDPGAFVDLNVADPTVYGQKNGAAAAAAAGAKTPLGG
jgi:hypothetical protein